MTSELFFCSFGIGKNKTLSLIIEHWLFIFEFMRRDVIMFHYCMPDNDIDCFNY